MSSVSQSKRQRSWVQDQALWDVLEADLSVQFPSMTTKAGKQNQWNSIFQLCDGNLYTKWNARIWTYKIWTTVEQIQTRLNNFRKKGSKNRENWKVQVAIILTSSIQCPIMRSIIRKPLHVKLILWFIHPTRVKTNCSLSVANYINDTTIAKMGVSLINAHILGYLQTLISLQPIF